MAKSLACLFGRHRWTSRTEVGEHYVACAVCGKEQERPSRGDIVVHNDVEWEVPRPKEQWMRDPGKRTKHGR
jgi:hypothetical protein